ncbi:hypothetical protein LOTGIDRAFT_163412 [Lottia gigantea]|uniref:Death domain-containing protein n=1 Tax=Lottia gigantea TaxID=225164 RepID=V3ZK55_LOTGI|nr:hypothetical protein LOTGIDRAFT_163412 [Lottia gigantea]ESO91683.1 hypothetical protein LOTGIDRAFT_163412 [Lottia gigantea]
MKRMRCLFLGCALVVAFIYFSSTFVSATVDMNIKELQFVADHLTPEECIQVEAALRQNRFQIDWEQLKKDTKTLNEKTKSTPCLVRLVNWDRGKAKHLTFQDLAIRLKELGFVEVSDKISKNVNHEKAEEVKESFVDDPFKELVPTKSLLLDEPKDLKSAQIKPAPIEEESHYNVILWSVLGSLSFTLLLLVSCYVCCPEGCCTVWRKTVPQGCSVGCDMLVYQCSACCSRLGKDTEYHLLDGEETNQTDLDSGQIPSFEEVENAITRARSVTRNV